MSAMASTYRLFVSELKHVVTIMIDVYEAKFMSTILFNTFFNIKKLV